MTKKLWLILSLLVIFAMIAGCTGAATPAPEQPAPPAEEEAAPATEAAAPAEEEAAPATEEAAPAEEAAGGAKDPLADNKITIAWIPKALNNPVFEIG
ncbi:MAG TPA: hypothetical protein VEC93_19515, partial [Anaerolineae bacterium]|nr:hypothetical protein [Anaerolineae bacterium]